MFKRNKNKTVVEKEDTSGKTATGINYSEKSPSMTVYSPFTGRKKLHE
ncbi:hypothetical protein MmiHf6_08300 [Methanimicrococcus hongohii]|uniref:Uncharacterized protein n=1 Tax=Methanimicrococcus hongohii TaxID=3028295 RepID=A0AA96VAQ3_9EURY|nr:hypothetical protein [Methanimicrococcus sp. Hf6]WNY23522.1 hypothetical protein MmiHf6_08300 [Methanimicrococcus sp. Hf6]